MEATGCSREQPSPVVDPDVKTRVTGGCNQIRIPVAIDVGDHKSDDDIAGVPRISLRETREEQRRKRTERRENQPAYGEDRRVDDAVSFHGSCDLDHIAIMQNPD